MFHNGIYQSVSIISLFTIQSNPRWRFIENRWTLVTSLNKSTVSCIMGLKLIMIILPENIEPAEVKAEKLYDQLTD